MRLPHIAGCCSRCRPIPLDTGLQQAPSHAWRETDPVESVAVSSHKTLHQLPSGMLAPMANRQARATHVERVPCFSRGLRTRGGSGRSAPTLLDHHRPVSVGSCDLDSGFALPCLPAGRSAVSGRTCLCFNSGNGRTVPTCSRFPCQGIPAWVRGPQMVDAPNRVAPQAKWLKKSRSPMAPTEVASVERASWLRSR
jgi:hypothetical protein